MNGIMRRLSGLALVATVTACAGLSSRGSSLDSVRASDVAKAKQNQDLIYVTNGNAEVTVYGYTSLKLVRVLTDFTKPMGECADDGGNVYITDESANQILEYAHGGGKPTHTFDDSPDSPYSCAVDPVTGNLAVANIDGNIAIWSKGSDVRTTYTDSKLSTFQGCAYDAAGDLLVTSGYVGSDKPSLFAWLPEGGTKLINITVPGPEANFQWRSVEGIQWDGSYFALDNGETIYRVTLIHGQAYYVGSTNVYGGGGQFGFYSAKTSSSASVVVGPVSSLSSSAIGFWNYPAGGEPTLKITHGVDRPFAAVISRG